MKRLLGPYAEQIYAITRIVVGMMYWLHGTTKWFDWPPGARTRGAVELASLNSREFQDRREDLYLAALPVTLERFAFAAQFEALNTTIREWAGSQSSVGQRNGWLNNSSVGLSKLFSTGALLLVQFSNQTLINLGGTQPRTLSQSVINLDLVQPLLRGGGRATTR